jgi:hypothetical protein
MESIYVSCKLIHLLLLVPPIDHSTRESSFVLIHFTVPDLRLHLILLTRVPSVKLLGFLIG